MSKPSNEVTQRYQDKVYDDIRIRIPKWKRKIIQDYAASKGTSVNGMVNEFFRKELGMTEEQWKERTPEPEKGEDDKA